MPKLVQKSGYVRAVKAGGYMKYIATREGVEKLEANCSSEPEAANAQELSAPGGRRPPGLRQRGGVAGSPHGPPA